MTYPLQAIIGTDDKNPYFSQVIQISIDYILQWLISVLLGSMNTDIFDTQERPFYYLETNFLNARKFFNKQDLKDQLLHWLVQSLYGNFLLHSGYFFLLHFFVDIQLK